MTANTVRREGAGEVSLDVDGAAVRFAQEGIAWPGGGGAPGIRAPPVASALRATPGALERQCAHPAPMRHAYGDGRTYAPPDYYVHAFDIAHGRALPVSFACYVDNSPAQQPGHTPTAFAFDALLVGPTGAVCVAVAYDGAAEDANGDRRRVDHARRYDKTTSSTITTFAPVITYRVIVRDRAGTRVLDSQEQTGSTPPLAGLRHAGGTLAWSDHGQPRSAELG